jgi:hypothetical protein
MRTSERQGKAVRPATLKSVRFVVLAGVVLLAAVVVAVVVMREVPEIPEREPTVEPVPTHTPLPRPPPAEDPLPEPERSRLLYSAADVVEYRRRMSGAGPFYATGDAGHGGPYSPGDGRRAEEYAAAFLADPGQSYWSQPNLPYAPNDPWPGEGDDAVRYVRPLHAAWVWMTQPGHPRREVLEREVKALLLVHAADPTLEYGNATKYPVDFHGAAGSPIFRTALWMTRLIKARDMLGREAFSAAENAQFDRWIFDYANWSFQWLHQNHSKHLPGRLDRDYSVNKLDPTAERRSYDDGPYISYAGMAYTNRHAAVMSAASLAANYLAHFGYSPPTAGGPAYGRMTIDQLLDQSRLFAEETLRFSVWPQGVQGDFERGDRNVHENVAPQQGWLYSANVVSNLVEMAEYHAKRGDWSVWDHGTTAGYGGSAGTPVAGGFTRKNLHFYTWSMSRYVNDAWGRRSFGEPLARPPFYHDVITAATAHRFASGDGLLAAAWQRSGHSFPAYPQHPQSQGPFHAHTGEGAKHIGLIEHGGMPALRQEDRVEHWRGGR